MEERKLTEQQMEFYNKNHNLVYHMARKVNHGKITEDILSSAEYGFIEAISRLDFSRKHEEQIGYCAKYMRKEICKQIYFENSGVSVYFAKKGFSENSCEDMNEYSKNYDDVEYRLLCDEVRKSLTNKHRQVFDLLVAGNTRIEIAKKLNCTRQNVDMYYKTLKKIVKKKLEVR